MDYTAILEKAYHNSVKRVPKNEIRCYATKLKPVQKDEKSKKLSENVKKFLEKQKEVEDRKREEAEERFKIIEQKKKEIRTKRKSSSKFLTKNTAEVDQSMVMSELDEPDEDDYGYVSQEASEFHKKFLQKYKQVEETTAKKSSEDIKVKLQMKSKPKTNKCNSSNEQKVLLKNESKPVKVVKNIPPQMSFQDLLKLAQQKQHEPIIVEKKVVEDQRLMTKKQLEEYQKEQESKRRREQKWSNYGLNQSTLKTKNSDIGQKKTTPAPLISPTPIPSKTKSKKAEVDVKKLHQSVMPKMSKVPKSSNKALHSKPVVGKRKRPAVYLDDDEYDSEMDDFIDDTPEDTSDISQVIKQIFKYDKSRYKGDDDNDCEAMESSYRDQMREEIVSAKIGLMEDLDDIRKENEEKRRKAKFKQFKT